MRSNHSQRGHDIDLEADNNREPTNEQDELEEAEDSEEDQAELPPRQTVLNKNINVEVSNE